MRGVLAVLLASVWPLCIKMGPRLSPNFRRDEAWFRRREVGPSRKSGDRSGRTPIRIQNHPSESHLITRSSDVIVLNLVPVVFLETAGRC